MDLSPEIKAFLENDEKWRKLPPVSTPHNHVDSGWRCLVYHGKGKPQCYKCEVCHEWIGR